jgi:RNA polymerase sigma-70 factor (ECF subfamily)
MAEDLPMASVLTGREMSHDPTHESLGEGDDFVALITRSQRALQVFITGLTPTAGDAEDVLQNVNMALWRKRDSYNAGQEFLPWAFGFAMMEIRKFRERMVKSRLRFADATIEAIAADFPTTPTYVQDRYDALFRCLEKLGVRDRQMITDFYAGGATAQKLANRNSIPLSTVYKALTRARTALRLCVERTILQEMTPRGEQS